MCNREHHCFLGSRGACLHCLGKRERRRMRACMCGGARARVESLSLSLSLSLYLSLSLSLYHATPSSITRWRSTHLDTRIPVPRVVRTHAGTSMGAYACRQPFAALVRRFAGTGTRPETRLRDFKASEGRRTYFHQMRVSALAPMIYRGHAERPHPRSLINVCKLTIHEHDYRGWVLPVWPLLYLHRSTCIHPLTLIRMRRLANCVALTSLLPVEARGFAQSPY